jgi:hypothetical protein
MPQIPLYGYIDNPIYEDKVLYIVKEIQVSPTEYRYEGLIGWGFDENEFDSVPGSISINPITGESTVVKNLERAVNNPDFPVKYISYDMRDFIFNYDTEKETVTVGCYWRYEMHETEFNALKKNLESDHIDEDDDGISYPYFRFPRTKDGVAVSRVFNTIFKDKNIKIFVPKEHLG